MDERNKDLIELVGYGNLLLNDMPSSDAAEETIKTLERQMKEHFADKDNQAMLDVQTSLKKLKKAVKKIGKK